MRFLTIVIVVMAMSAKCQEFHIPISDTLNRFEDGKAVGYWVKYLDKNFEEGVKLKKAKHWHFVYYYNEDIYLHLTPGGKCAYFVHDGDTIEKPQLMGEPMNGKYDIYYGNDEVMETRYYENGVVRLDSAFYRNGKLRGVMDFRDPYNDKKYSYHKQEFDRRGNLITDIFYYPRRFGVGRKILLAESGY